MHAAGVKRLLCVSSSAIGPHPEPLGGFVFERVMQPYVVNKLGKTLYDDMRRMEAMVSATDLAWTIVRPSGLFEAPAVSAYSVAIDHIGYRYTAQVDLADCLLRQALSDAYVRSTIAIATTSAKPRRMQHDQGRTRPSPRRRPRRRLNEEDFADGEHRYDVILDTGGNRPLSQLRRALTPHGTLVIVGGETGGRSLEGADRLLRAPLEFVGTNFAGLHLSEHPTHGRRRLTPAARRAPRIGWPARPGPRPNPGSASRRPTPRDRLPALKPVRRRARRTRRQRRDRLSSPQVRRL